MNKKVFLFNPPVGFFQRGEDRCQANIEGSTSGALRACNDLGYMAAIARNYAMTAKIMDYPAEKMEWSNFIADFKQFMPDIAIMSITTATIEKDMEAFKIAKELNPNVITIAKGAHFFGCSTEELAQDIYKVMDYAISGEAEFIIGELFEAILGKKELETIKGLFYWNEEKNQILKTEDAGFEQNLDDLPFPARDLMNNTLYIRPDNAQPMATISTSRGCPSSCIYCLTPAVSGKKIRKRSAIKIVDEIQECVEKHNIKEFFFKADTFTIDRKWVTEVCQEISKRGLKISWGANSRVKPIDYETLKLMKDTGCWLVAFGIESGSEESLKRMKKGATKEDAQNAVKMAKKAGLKVYAYYLFGFPWEKEEHIQETIDFAKKLNCDYVEFHIVVPFEGTELYAELKESGYIEESATGHDSFLNPVMKTDYLTTQDLLNLKNKAVMEVCLNPRYILRTLGNIRTPKEFVNYAKFGIRMIKNTILN